MALIKASHDLLFRQKTDELRGDIGKDIILHIEDIPEDCKWCVLSSSTGKSSGIPENGKDWSTHPEYQGSLIICPNCLGAGVISNSYTKTIEDVIVEDKSGIVYDRGKMAVFPEGTKSLIGKLADVIIDSTDLDSETYFAKANKIIVDGQDHFIKSVKKFGLLDDYLFEAIVQINSPTNINKEALTT